MLDLKKLNYRKIKLESERLVLEEIPMDCRNKFFEIFSDKEVLRYTDRSITNTIDEAIVFLKDCQVRADEKEHFFLGIFLKTNHQLLGILSLYHIDLKHAFASLGILLAKEHWRKGFMREALKRFMDFYFNELNFRRLEAQTFVDNLPAVKFFENLKFTKEGKLRENFKIEGKFEDSYLFAMLQDEYNSFYS